MAKLRQDGTSVVVDGPGGSFRFDRDYSPGSEGPGEGTYEYLFELYEQPDRLVVVVSRIVEHYGRNASHTVYESRDGAASFQVKPTEPHPEGRSDQFLYVT
jgi:hypothetical protein